MGVSKSGLEKYWNWKNFTESSVGKFLPWIATKHSKSAGILFEIQMYLLLNERNQSLPAGQIVLAGAATAAVSLEKEMKISLEVEGLGSTSITVEE